MPHCKIYGNRPHIERNRTQIAHALEQALIEALNFRGCYMRFFAMESENFMYPETCGPQHTVVEVFLKAGRDPELKKAFMSSALAYLEQIGIPKSSVDLWMFEFDASQRAIRGTIDD